MLYKCRASDLTQDRIMGDQVSMANSTAHIKEGQNKQGSGKVQRMNAKNIGESRGPERMSINRMGDE